MSRLAFSTRLQDFFNRGRDPQPQLGSVRDNTGGPLRPITRILKIQGLKLMFGMRWQPIHDDADLKSLLKKFKADGSGAYVANDTAELLGVSDIAPQGPTYSAALVLSASHSKNVNELFIFQVQNDYVLIALNKGLPVPGFDLVGSKQDIHNAAQLYSNIHGEQHIRFIGNVNWMAAIEPLDPQLAFGDTTEDSQVKSLRQTGLLIPLVLVLGLAGMGFGGYSWYQTQQESQRLARTTVAEDPNIAYEEQLQTALQSLGTTGSGLVDVWNALLETQPSRLAGWDLSVVKCRSDLCEVHWARDFGSNTDFYEAAQSQLGIEPVIEFGKNLQDTKMITSYPIQAVGNAPLDRQQLLSTAEAKKVLGAQLQDLLLLGATNVAITEPSLFGGNRGGGQVAGLQSPVMRGEFMIEGPLWMLSGLAFPSFTVPAGMELTLTPSESGANSGLVKTKFILTGGYFSNGQLQ